MDIALAGFSNVNVKWVFRDEFIIQISPDEGKLTDVKAATFDEYLPFT